VDLILRIGSDPASWIVTGGDYEGLVAQLSRPAAPVVADVISPLVGRLVLSPKAAGSVVILQPSGGGLTWQPFDWNPGGAIKPSGPVVYLASPAGPFAGTSRYTVSADLNAQGVEQDVIAAMSDDTKRILTLPVSGPAGTGMLVVDGATLPFAVVC
jgi:hypothetical protein